MRMKKSKYEIWKKYENMKICQRKIDEQAEAELGQAQPKLRLRINDFWNKDLDRQVYNYQ